MKTLTYLFVCILLSFMYSCSSSEVDIPTPLNDQSRIKELQDFAKDCGYTDLMINICRPLTDKDIELYRSLIFNKKRTGRDAQRQQKMYLTEVGYDGGNYTLQFDYSFDGDTGEILEAYGGVYGLNHIQRYNDLYIEIQTLPSRLDYMNNDRFDLIIRAYYLTGIDGPYGSSNSFYGHRYRLVIRAGLNIKTNISTCQFEQQGEGQWPLEP